MKQLKAIYLPDLAYNEKYSTDFIFNKETEKFHMILNDEFVYDVGTIYEDEDWMFFETELIQPPKYELAEHCYGIVKRIPNNELLKYIDNLLKE